MKTSIRIANQRGVALVLALLLLFVLITIGVAGFGNTHLQERSASNARLQAEAFKAASAGAANAINFFVANRDRDDIGIEDADCGATNHAGWYDSTDPTIAVPTDWVKPTEWPAASAASDNIGQAVLSQRMYCLADAYPCGAEDEELGFDCSVTARPPRSQLFVVSRGQVIVDEKVVASRDIEVRVARARDGTPGDGCGAICFPACEIDTANTEFPNSNSFVVDGVGEPAITVGCESGEADILSEIRANRRGNYLGGIEHSDAGLPWNSPQAVEDFRLGVEQAALDARLYDGCGSCYYENGLDISGNPVFGTVESPQITYIEGDADIGGTVSGAGIFFVNGNLLMNGTPDYKGLIVVLGGYWEVDGGGTGGNQAGSVVVLNAPGADDDGNLQDFGEIAFHNTGGGTALYKMDCNMLMLARSLLPDAVQQQWNPECNGVEDLFILGPERIIIASWRENIGWREELFAD